MSNVQIHQGGGKINRLHFHSFMLLIFTFLSQGIQAQNNSDILETLKKDLTNLELHQSYIYRAGIDDSTLQANYASWIQKYPDNVQIPFILGKSYLRKDRDRSKKYLKRAVELDSLYAEAWYMLSLNAYFQGKSDSAAYFVYKAYEAAPKNVFYLMRYADYFKTSDPSKYVQINLRASKILPKDINTGIALLTAANAEIDPVMKESYYIQLRGEYDNEVFPMYQYAMEQFYEFLFENTPKKASLHASIVSKKTAVDTAKWEILKQAAANYDLANTMIDKKQYGLAEEAANKVKLDSSRPTAKLALIQKAKIYAALGNKLQAYNLLMDEFVRQPDVPIRIAMESQADQLGKDEKTIYKEIWARLGKNLKKASDFTLANSITGDSVSLSDYAGKVVLLTYWFPGCGPCRAEFPHFENVLDKLGNDRPAYFALNILKREEHLIEPFFKTNDVSFTSLNDYKRRARGTLDNNNYAPVNFIIDKYGNILFSHFKTHEHNESELEEMLRLAMRY